MGQRTLQRYEELLRVHVKPTLGGRPLQQLRATEIDKLYTALEAKIAPVTLHHLHTTFNSCLSTAKRKGLLLSNPIKRAERIPSPGESDHGLALSEQELNALAVGFKPLPSLYRQSRSMRRSEPIETRCWRFAGSTSILRRRRSA